MNLTVFIFLSLSVISLWDAANVFGTPVEGDFLTTGTPLGSPPLVDLISNDPILRGVKVFQQLQLFFSINYGA